MGSALAIDELVTTVGTARIACHYLREQADGLPECEQEKWLEVSYYLERSQERATRRLQRLARLEGRTRRPPGRFVERVQGRLNRLIRDVVEHF